MVLPTWNDAARIVRCLGGLALQSSRDFEVIIVDRGSTDLTMRLVQDVRPCLAVPVRVEQASVRLSASEARALGVKSARGSAVLLLDAAVVLDGRWIEIALQALDTADLVVGRHLFAHGGSWSTRAARTARLLVQRVPGRRRDDVPRDVPLIAAAVRREMLDDPSFALATGPGIGQARDGLLMGRAATEGRTIAYEPRLVSFVSDETGFRRAVGATLQQATAAAAGATNVGGLTGRLAWGLSVVAASIVAAFLHTWSIALLIAMIWVPAIMRSRAHIPVVPARELLAGILVSPLFDALFLGRYLLTFIHRRTTRHARPSIAEIHP